MKATYLNKYEDVISVYFDLSFEFENNILLRLSGVKFEKDFTYEELQLRALEILKEALPEYSLTEIIIQ